MILGCVTCLQGWKLPAGGAGGVGDVVGYCDSGAQCKIFQVRLGCANAILCRLDLLR